MIYALAGLWDMSLNPLDVVCRLGMAVFFGAMIGLERQVRAKGTNVRTLVIVSLGSALFVLAAEEIIASTPGASRLSTLAPIVGGLIGGVGFLGAGAILQQENQIEGVTTAATIWVTSAVGMTCGIGEFTLAGLVGSAVTITLLAFRGVENGKRRTRSEANDRGISSNDSIVDRRNEPTDSRERTG